ncbi:hypothetical protein [Nocardia transvalensis]|uniref:hypothetical protein n=1 Tax=Nocardia transvalensis TaxID=37333 RepID=UPI0018936C66|nr:hypothetical protein [Nocardia transvalensis]MBF6329780.1 hypothetical protein [Nocardia transvalensis]
MSVSDAFADLDPEVRQALMAWDRLTAAEWDYAVGYVAGYAPAVMLKAVEYAVATATEVAELKHLFRMEAQQ